MSPHSRVLQLLGAKLAEAEVSESQLIAWLKQRKAVPPGIFALQSIPRSKLEILNGTITGTTPRSRRRRRISRSYDPRDPKAVPTRVHKARAAPAKFDCFELT
jgi:hypothetical protein